MMNFKQENMTIVKHHTSLNPYELYLAIGADMDCILLDSSKEDSSYSQYSIIGIHPYQTVKYEEGTIYVREQYQSFSPIEETDIFQCLKAILSKYDFSNDTDLPFIGGGIGYFSYDLSRSIEALPDLTEINVSIPDCYFVFYDNYLIYDHHKKEVSIVGLGILEDSKISTGSLLNLIKNDSNCNSKTPPADKFDLSPLTFSSPFNRETYISQLHRMKNYIKKGHIYIANMTHTFSCEYDKDSLATYAQLRKINPAPFSAYLPLDGFQILSSSPERFIKINDRIIQTRPIKGTVPRDEDPEIDMTNRLWLENSEKDKSELLMIVDLERNDLSKVCIHGTVNVPEMFEIESYATVYHLVSTIEGKLKPGLTPLDCMKAAFPGGSITGAPKIRAMEIIEELEATRRNIYTGCIGYVGFDGNADFNIAIRTILLKDEHAYIGVGGGITWDSNEDSEYQETLDKAKALFAALNSTH